MTTQVNSLYRIEQPNKTRPPKVVGREIISLYRKDFHFTGAKLCRLFDCDRRWIENFIRPNVQHILVTYFFRQYILDQFKDSLDEQEFSDLANSYYFYSQKDLERFWRETAAAKQKTTVIDLSDYLDMGSSSSALIEEQHRHRHTKSSKEEQARHLDTMEILLTEKGYSLYLASKYKKAEWTPVPLPKLPLESHEEPLLTTRRIMKKRGLRTDGTAYKYLMGVGAVHIKFGGKTYWHVVEHSGKWLISVPLDGEG